MDFSSLSYFAWADMLLFILYFIGLMFFLFRLLHIQHKFEKQVIDELQCGQRYNHVLTMFLNYSLLFLCLFLFIFVLMVVNCVLSYETSLTTIRYRP